MRRYIAKDEKHREKLDCYLLSSTSEGELDFWK